MNPKIDEYINSATLWQEEMKLLREIILSCGLTEEWKWRIPCYTMDDNNIVMIQAFKKYCALGFFKGSLLKDPNGILVKPGENTQGGRQIRFANVIEMESMKDTVKAYIFEAIEVEKAGMKVAPKKEGVEMPEELKTKFVEMPALKASFESLTPGRQRAYIMHFSAAKQSKTRDARITKNIERILSGKGLNDCICGMSKKMPNCDGSHKFI